MPPVNITDLRRIARQRLPKPIFDHVDGGAYDELTLHRNHADLDALALNERVMKDVAKLSTATAIAGDSASMPLALLTVGGGTDLAEWQDRRCPCLLSVRDSVLPVDLLDRLD